MTTLLAPHPFGHTITAQGLTDTFARFQQWEDRYRQLIQLSRQLPALPEELKTALPACLPLILRGSITAISSRCWLNRALRCVPGSTARSR
ncbi:hypothetical protein CRX72_02890 [Pantoea sp. BRM17]|nr:hypothetical protein CRX72_02890 [Pantoea sp. BRM17]